MTEVVKGKTTKAKVVGKEGKGKTTKAKVVKGKSGACEKKKVESCKEKQLCTFLQNLLK